MGARINSWGHDFWRTALFLALGATLLSTVSGQRRGRGRGRSADPTTKNFDCRPNGCCDQHEWCSFWLGIGECKNNTVWMRENCQISCGTCSVEGSGSGRGQRPTQPRPRPRSRTKSPGTTRRVPTSTPASRTRARPTPATRAQPKPATTRAQARPATTRTQPKPKPATTAARPVVVTRPFSGAATCQGIQSSGMGQASELISKFRLVQAREDVRSRRTLGISDVFDTVTKNSCAPSISGNQCGLNLCYHLKYRTFDGTCNNMADPLRGSAYQSYMRLLPPQYDDGISAPVATTRRKRPTPREACRFLLASPQQVLSSKFSALLMQWGQFISHDLAKTHLHRSSDCSSSCQDVPGKCFNIQIQRSDPLSNALRGQPCFKMARSVATCGTALNGRPRQQYNENTPYIDASQVYGSSEDDHRRFRQGASAFMQLTNRGSHPLPKHDPGKCTSNSNCNNRLFETGDDRSNIFVGLAALHTLMLREHNRIATQLKRLNPRWDDDQVFQETRKIIGSLIQRITYNEWLPKILGSRMEAVIGAYRGYDPSVNPAVANEFNSAAFRFGHGMIQEIYDRLDPQGRVMNKLRVDDGINNPEQIVFGGGIDPILRGLMVVGAKRPQRMTPAVTERMFGNTDLASTNIQRGRDHGIPGYNEYRAFCGLPKARTFEDLKNEILDGQLRKNLDQGYSNVDEVDLYVGAVLEDPVVGGMVGPTLSCIIGNQFKRTRDGDRFWHQNPGVFSPRQRAELEKSSLARILCDNADQFEFVPRDAFQLTTGPNLVSCREIPSMDLNAWRQA